MSKSILVVDDDPDLLFCYRLMLENESTMVFTSDDVDEAIEIVREESIDLAILDYMMPKLRGDKLAERIHGINSKVRIIFVSGYAEVVEAIKKLEITIHGVFMKPINPEVMEKISRSEDYSELDNVMQSDPGINVYSNI